MAKIFHQLGHNSVWNFTSLKEDKAGDGLILSPRHMSRADTEVVTDSCKQPVIFDPQFFVPGTARGQLATYSFYPEVAAGGYETEEYTEAQATTSAKECVEFQVENAFSHIVIPTRYFEEMRSDFMQLQDRSFVIPFQKAIQNVGSSKKILLQLVLHEGMIKDETFATELLNWITAKRVHGVYLIVSRTSMSKQIKDPTLLYSLLSFIHSLRDAQMEVVLGYLNTEAFLLALADPSVVTMGAYEANRNFKERNFQAPKDDGRKSTSGPNLRLYVPKLLQWIEVVYLGIIAKKIPNETSLFEPAEFQNRIYDAKFNGEFKQPEIYRHHFQVFYSQLRTILGFSGNERFRFLVEAISRAIELHGIIEEQGIVLGPDNDGSHLPSWLTAAQLFANDRKWSR